jgi:hypothetical protein
MDAKCSEVAIVQGIDYAPLGGAVVRKPTRNLVAPGLTAIRARG